MLMHEWIKFRDAQIKRAGEPGGATETGTAAAPEPPAEVARPVEEPPAEAPDRDAEPIQDGAADAESTNREKEALLESLNQELLENGRNVQGRLRALQGRQRQLPMDVGETTARTTAAAGPKGATETREDLVRRLLDPTLTLKEAALLLDVCPTTVRRYTNRGLLSCYRTAGNQRRFRLTDVLDFIERREREGL